MITFIAAVFFMIITPGPGVLSAAGVGAAFGMRAGLRYITGLCIGQALVFLAVATGFSALVLAIPSIRFVLLTLSFGYLLYLAFRIALAGSEVAFIRSAREPGIREGFLLQPINPKAYAVITAQITGFSFLPDNYVAEVMIKFVILNILWIPLHVAWVWFGVSLKRLNLPQHTQRVINYTMAASMIVVVALAVLTIR